MKEKFVLDQQLEQHQKSIRTLQESIWGVQKMYTNPISDLKYHVAVATRYDDWMKRQLALVSRHDDWMKHQLAVVSRYEDFTKRYLAEASRYDDLIKHQINSQQKFFDSYTSNQREIVGVGTLEKIAGLGRFKYDALQLEALDQTKGIGALGRVIEGIVSFKPTAGISPRSEYGTNHVSSLFASCQRSIEGLATVNTDSLTASLAISGKFLSGGELLSPNSAVLFPLHGSSRLAAIRHQEQYTGDEFYPPRNNLCIGRVENLHVTLTNNGPVSALQIGNNNTVTERNFSQEGDAVCDLLVLLHDARDTLHLVPDKFRAQAKEEIENLIEKLVRVSLYSDTTKGAIHLVARLLLTAPANATICYRILSLGNQIYQDNEYIQF